MNSEKVDLIVSALIKAQQKVKAVSKDAANPFFKSKYAPLENYIEAFHEYYTPEGLAFTQTGRVIEGKNYLCTTLWHSSGQWIQSYYPLSPVKGDPQSLGAAYTYAKRYDLAGITGMSTGDDDAESAIDRVKVKEPQSKGESGGNAPTRQNPRLHEEPPLKKPGMVSAKQVEDLLALSIKHHWSDNDLKDYMKTKLGIERLKDMNFVQWYSFCDYIKKVPKVGQTG